MNERIRPRAMHGTVLWASPRKLSKKAKGTYVIEGLETKRMYRACSERGVK